MNNQESAETKKFLDAIKQGQYQMLKDMLEQQSISLDDKNEGLLEAAENGNLDIVQLLIKKGAQINESHILEYAVKKEFEHVVEFLLTQEGVDVDNPDNDKYWSNLMFAAWNGNQKIAQLLLDHDADIHHENIFEQTPLIFAARECKHKKNNCNYDIMQSLLHLLHSNLEEINRQDYYGYSALAYAIGHACTKTVKLLLEAGADPFLEYRDGTAFEHTKKALHFVAKEQEKLNQIYTMLATHTKEL
ncbi:MAG: ankyrin repeat domain-containing protein [Candidatus Babeliales bacterium]